MTKHHCSLKYQRKHLVFTLTFTFTSRHFFLVESSTFDSPSLRLRMYAHVFYICSYLVLNEKNRYKTLLAIFHRFMLKTVTT